MDIKTILSKWNYDPYELSVRVIDGEDGKQKIQIRLDLGLLQLEMTGRPDGDRPHDRESYLEYFTEMALEKENEASDDFKLDSIDCDDLRTEAIQYYHRYISFLELENYKRVISDTQHNLSIINLMRDYAVEEVRSRSFEQFRPYILMINTMAKGRHALSSGEGETAKRHIHDGITKIKKAKDDLDYEDHFYGVREIKFLEEWNEDISGEIPNEDVKNLQKKLDRAVLNEDYERAAKLRDEIAAYHQDKS